MRLGIGSYTFPWAVGIRGSAPPRPMTAGALLDKAVALKVSLVQFADNLPLDRLEEPELEALRRLIRQRGLAVEVGTRGIAPAHLSTYLALAIRFSSPIVRTLIDTPQWRPAPAEVVSVLKEIIPAFESAGVGLAMENHDRFKAKELLDIIDRVGSERIGICFDTANSFGCAEGPESVLEILGPRVLDLHLKDFHVRRAGPSQGFVVEGRPAGEGQLEIPSLLEKLRHFGRDPNAILEQWPPPEHTVAETVDKEATWAETGIQYLRQFIPA
jgi:sugar phosphate isomerase/epimerase